MNEISFLSALLIGIAGSVHCVGMCGGIVGAFTLFLPKNVPIWPFLLMYNLGRISSYTLAGAIAGYFSQMITSKSAFAGQVLLLISGVFLLLLALYIGNVWRLLTHLEGLGKRMWMKIQPYSKRFVPFKSPLSALPYGFIWGWLPCGLVYSTLSWSLASGSALKGASLMLAFGMGTLPAMLAMGASGATLKAWLVKPGVRQVIAAMLAIYGLILIYQAINNWL